MFKCYKKILLFKCHKEINKIIKTKTFMVFTLWARFTKSLRQRKPSFGIKIVAYSQDLLKTRSEELVLKRRGHIYFCTRPY